MLTISHPKRSKGKISNVDKEKNVALNMKLRERNASGKRSIKTFGTLEGWSLKLITTIGRGRDENRRSVQVSSGFGAQGKVLQLLPKQPKYEIAKR